MILAKIAYYWFASHTSLSPALHSRPGTAASPAHADYKRADRTSVANLDAGYDNYPKRWVIALDEESPHQRRLYIEAFWSDRKLRWARRAVIPQTNNLEKLENVHHRLAADLFADVALLHGGRDLSRRRHVGPSRDLLVPLSERGNNPGAVCKEALVAEDFTPSALIPAQKALSWWQPPTAKTSPQPLQLNTYLCGNPPRQHHQLLPLPHGVGKEGRGSAAQNLKLVILNIQQKSPTRTTSTASSPRLSRTSPTRISHCHTSRGRHGRGTAFWRSTRATSLAQTRRIALTSCPQSDALTIAELNQLNTARNYMASSSTSMTHHSMT